MLLWSTGHMGAVVAACHLNASSVVRHKPRAQQKASQSYKQSRRPTTLKQGAGICLNLSRCAAAAAATAASAQRTKNQGTCCAADSALRSGIECIWRLTAAAGGCAHFLQDFKAAAADL